jgi:hypothetical protein
VYFRKGGAEPSAYPKVAARAFALPAVEPMPVRPFQIMRSLVGLDVSEEAGALVDNRDAGGICRREEIGIQVFDFQGANRCLAHSQTPDGKVTDGQGSCCNQLRATARVRQPSERLQPSPSNISHRTALAIGAQAGRGILSGCV